MQRTIGHRIREARQARGMSLAQLGGEDLSRSFLSLVETGRSRISLRALAIVADRLDLPMRHFVDALDSPEPPSETGSVPLEWTVHVRQPAPDRVSIELSLDTPDAVRHIRVHVPNALVHLDDDDRPDD
jgi:transcriptional regulator with XRE-family HTH domain